MNAANLICLKHQVYDGSTPPTLSCKTCCYIFVGRLREQVSKKKNAETSKEMKEHRLAHELKGMVKTEKSGQESFLEGL